MPYHELVARLIAKRHTCELLGHDPSNITVPFSKGQQHGYGNFQTYGSLHWLIFQDRLGSKLLRFSSLHTFCFSKNYSLLPSIRGCHNFY
jgi:hypothetical protein